MAANTQDVIMLFGDSLTQRSWEDSGIAQRLAAAYVRKLDVINRGYSGFQTNWAIPVFEQIFAKRERQDQVPKVRLLTIWFGANDAAPPPSSQHVPRELFKKNLTSLLDMVGSEDSEYFSPDTRVILITPPPVNTRQRQGRDFSTTKSYAEAVKEVGGTKGVPVADIWTEIWEAAGRKESSCKRFLHDGLHLNGAGYEIVYKSIMTVIQEKYPEIHYEKLRPVSPLYVESDHFDVASITG